MNPPRKKNLIGNWLNDIFFVKDAKASLAIGLLSVAIGIAVDLLLVWLRTIDDAFSLNQCGRLGDMLIRFTAGISVASILYFTICGLYNLVGRSTRNSNFPK